MKKCGLQVSSAAGVRLRQQNKTKCNGDEWSVNCAPKGVTSQMSCFITNKTYDNKQRTGQKFVFTSTSTPPVAQVPPTGFLHLMVDNAVNNAHINDI